MFIYLSVISLSLVVPLKYSYIWGKLYWEVSRPGEQLPKAVPSCWTRESDQCSHWGHCNWRLWGLRLFLFLAWVFVLGFPTWNWPHFTMQFCQGLSNYNNSNYYKVELTPEFVGSNFHIYSYRCIVKGEISIWLYMQFLSGYWILNDFILKVKMRFIFVIW